MVIKLDWKSISQTGIVISREMFIGLGFGDKWINWTMKCIRTTTLTMLIYGKPRMSFILKEALDKVMHSLPIFLSYVQNFWIDNIFIFYIVGEIMKYKQM